MALRSIDQRYWTDPYVESLSATEKLVYIHLFSSAHTNLVGVFQASRRMIDFQTACPGPDVDAALERFRRDGKAIYYSLDDDHVRSMISLGMDHVEE